MVHSQWKTFFRDSFNFNIENINRLKGKRTVIGFDRLDKCPLYDKI